MDELGVGVEYFKSPLSGKFTGEYLTNDDGSVNVLTRPWYVIILNPKTTQ